MAQHELGDVVYICGERVTITDRQHEDGRWLYRVNHATKPFWRAAWWTDSKLVSEADYVAKQTKRAQDTRIRADEQRIKRIGLGMSEPLECTFHTRLDYRRAYIGWAESWGGEEDRPDWVRQKYWKFMLMREDE